MSQQLCPLVPPVHPVHSDTMTLDQWEAFFPLMVPNEGVSEWTEEQLDEIEFLKKLRLRALPEIEEEPEWSEETYEYVASCVLYPKSQGECQGVVGASNPLLSPEIEVVKQRLLDKYATSVFTPICIEIVRVVAQIVKPLSI